MDGIKLTTYSPEDVVVIVNGEIIDCKSEEFLKILDYEISVWVMIGSNLHTLVKKDNTNDIFVKIPYYRNRERKELTFEKRNCFVESKITVGCKGLEARYDFIN